MRSRRIRIVPAIAAVITCVAAFAVSIATATSASATTCGTTPSYGTRIVAWSHTTGKSYVPGVFCVAVAAAPGPKLTFQSDGNLVLYDGSKAIWSSGTSGRGEKLDLQTDGNVVVYGCTGQGGVGCSPAHAIWSSGTDWGTYYLGDWIQLGVDSFTGNGCWAIIHSTHTSSTEWSPGGFWTSAKGNCNNTPEAA